MTLLAAPPGSPLATMRDADLFVSMSPEEFARRVESDGPRIKAEIERIFAETAESFRMWSW